MQEIAGKIQPYDASTDAASVFTLWQTAVGREWPVDFQRLQQILSGPDTRHFVAKENGQVIGFVGTMQSRSWDAWVGHLLVLLVAPAWQRKGLGSALYETALRHLRDSNTVMIQPGGHSPRFWCGVPADLTAAQEFFRARGWDLSETVYDLVQDVRQYSAPPALYQRVNEQQITLAPATGEDMSEVLAFEAREFPNWLKHYEHCARLGNYQDILVARDQNQSGQVVGTLLTSTPQSHPERTEVIWRVPLGYDAGSLGAVGVAYSEQGRGIGIALVARASELLRERGVRNCYIDWVSITDFYAKLGYSKWRAYHTSLRGTETL